MGCQLVTPTITVSTTAATCSANGTATVTNYLATNTYTSTPSGLTVGAAGVVTGFTCGTAYTITATNASSCTATSASFTVGCQLVSPTITGIVTTCSVNLTSYSIDFVSTGSVTSTLGTVSGSTVTNIAINQNVTLTATLNGCVTTLLVSSPNCSCGPINPPVGADKTICSTASIPALTVTVSDPVNETANWYTAGGTLLPSGSATLSYTPTVKSTLTYYVETENTSTGCKSNTKTPIKLTVDTPAIVNAGLDTSVCAGSNVTLSGASTTNATSLSWSAPAGKGTFTNVNTLTPTFTPDASITSGTIELTLTAQSGNACADVIDKLIVTVNPKPTLSVVSRVCAVDLQTYTITFTSNGTVSSTNGLVNNTTKTVSGISSGSGVTLTATSANSCETILVSPNYSCACSAMNAPTSGGNQTICQGDTIAPLSATPGTGETIDWYDAMTGGNLLVSTALTYTPNAAGTYYAEARNIGSNCKSARTPITLIINPVATANAGTLQSICQNNTATLAGTIGGSATSGTWSVNVLKGTIANPTSVNGAVFTPATGVTGDVTLTLTTNDPTGPCPAATSTVIVTINALPTANAGSDQTICENGNASLVGIIGGSATTASWSVVSGGSGTFSDFNALTTTFTPAAASSGNITLRLTTAATATCASVTDDVIITVNELPVVSAGSDAEVCANGTLTLNGSVLVNGTPTTGTWSAPSGTFGNINNLNSTYSPSITSGSVTLTLTSVDPTGPCGVITDTVVITVNPTPTLVVSNPAAVCVPATVNLTAAAVTTGSSAGTLTYWEDLNASIALGTTAGVGTPGAVATTGTYYIKNTSPKGCFAIRAVNTVVNSTPTINLICGPATINSVQFDWSNITGVTTYNYSYRVNGGPAVTGTQAAPSSFTVSGINDGDAVAFTLTTVGLPCNATKTITCNATPCPVPVITAVANIVSCSDNPIAQINFASIHNVTSIRWTNDNTAVGLAASGNGSSIAGSTAPTVTTKQIANITVIGTHMGCDGPVMSFTITINPKPSLSITNPAVVCAGQKVDLTAPAVTNGSMNLGPLSYYDTDGVTLLSTFNAVDVSGTYYIKSVAPGGCSDMKPVVVTINPLPTVINTVTDSRCGSGSLTLQAAANPTGTITWYDAAVNGNLLGTGNSFTTPNLTATKIYYAQAEDNGCISATRTPVTATITPPVTPYVEIIADKISVCEGTRITFKAVNPLNQGANPTYEWLINNISQGPATASNIFVTNILSSTNNNDVINVKMTSSLTCVTLPTFTTPAILIKVEPVTSPGVVISASPSGPVCANDSVSFTAVPNNIGTATPSYQWYKNGVAISGATSNTYTATPWINNDRIYCQLTSSSACATNRVVVSNDIIMTVKPNLAAAVTIVQNPPGAFCSGTAVTFTATPINGGTTPSYQWYVNGVNAPSTTATFTSATLLHNDVITVKMLSTENCISNNPATSGAIKVNVISRVIPSVSIVASANPICAGTAVTFTATPVNAGAAPLYQWYLNGTPISGQVTSKYTSTALVDKDQVWVEITNTDICGAKALSNIIIMTVHPLPDATLAGGITICKNGTKPILTFTGTNGIAPYTFTYTINNGPVQTITTSFGSAALLEVPTNTTGIYVYNLTSVSSSNTPSCSKNITGQQQTVIVDGIPATVVITTNTTTICPGLPITFVANTTNAGTSPTYQWLLNSNPIPGATTSTYTSSTLNNNDVLNVILTSSSPCVINSPVTSPGIQIKVTPAVTPLVSISADKNNICSGTPVTFTAIPTNGGSSPLYTWKVNGNVIQSTASVTFTSSSLNQNDKVTVEMTSNQACVVNNPAISNEIIMEVTPILAMTISINASETTICYGRTVDFIATAINAGNAATYQWYIGTKKVGTDSVYFSSNTLNNGDVVTCTVTNTENCFTGNPATSNSITMKVNPVITPSVTITSDRTAICKGSCVVFRANPVNGGPNVIYQWYLNDTPIAFANSINYTSCALVDNDRIHVRITNPAPCAAPSNSNEIVISVTELPTATITASTASVCKGGTSPEVTFTGFTGVAPYTFTYTENGVLKSIKTANTSDSVTLSVATTNSGMFNFSLASVTSGNTLACTQAQTGVVSIKVEAVPFAPKATLTQPTCTTGGSITVTNPLFDISKPLDIYTYSIDGVDYTNTTGVFTNLAGGSYNITYKNANGCPSLAYVVKINDDGKPVPTPKNGAICFDSVGNVINPYIIDSNLSPLNYTFVWSSGGLVAGTQSTLTTTTVGQYSLVATSKITGCVSDEVLVDVTEAVAPFVTTAVTAEFTGNTTVTVSATPAGNYEYQLDGGSFQTSNVFTGLSAGSHTVTVITGACEPVVVSVAIIDYPHYFTPNGDGINDHWNIIGLSDQPNAKIYIFDRFGKLLKQISSTSLGWDGTYNGQLLPSTDYWFTVEYTESGINKMFKAHFSLKR